MSYFKRKTMWVPLIASLVVAVPFAVNGLSGSRGGNPAFRTVALMTQARIADLAPVLKTTPDALVSKLKQGGYAVASTDETSERGRRQVRQASERVAVRDVPGRRARALTPSLHCARSSMTKSSSARSRGMRRRSR